MFLQECTISKRNGEVCSIMMQQEAVHQLYMVVQTQFLNIHPFVDDISVAVATCMMNFEPPPQKSQL